MSGTCNRCLKTSTCRLTTGEEDAACERSSHQDLKRKTNEYQKVTARRGSLKGKTSDTFKIVSIQHC